VNSFATLLTALMSLDMNTQFFHNQITIGLPNLAHTMVSGCSLSKMTIAYAQTSFFISFSTVLFIFPSYRSSTNFAITSLSVSE